MSSRRAPLAVYYENPHWFKPLFAELDRRGVEYVRLDPRAHRFDPTDDRPPYGLVFNRMSPSAFGRDAVQGIFYTHAWLAHLERVGTPVVNGRQAFAFETSKALQLTLLRRLGLDGPPSRVINHPAEAPAAAEGLRWPVVVKANVGGSGKGIVRFDRPGDLAAAVAAGRVPLGVDHTALVQEYVPARGGHITRVETLGGKFLYAIKVFTTGETFDLCPADICQTSAGQELSRSACPVDAPKTGLKVEHYPDIPAEVARAVERIVAAAGIDVGGVEYLTDDRDGRVYFYDVNALSNFVADAVRVVGFDPHARLVDYLVARLESR